MFIELIVLFLPIIALSVNVFVQAASKKFTRAVSLSIVSGFLAGTIMVLTLAIRMTENIEARIFCVLTYLTLAFCFWAFLNLNITSLRIRLLRELLTHHSGIKTEILLQRYSPHELVTRRMERLESSQQIQFKNERWFLSSHKLMIFVWVSLFLRRLIIPADKRDRSNA